MMEGLITMSNKELSRLDLFQKINSKELKQKDVALMLNLSIRHVKRLLNNYKKYGAKGLISKKRGASSNHQLSNECKSKALNLILNHYIDFGPTLAHEKLTEVHKLSLSISSVRNMMISNNIWQPKKVKKRRT